MACSKSLYNIFWRLLYKVRTCLFQPLSRNFKVAHGVNILTISICAIICGCDDFCAIEEYGKSKIDWFKSFLDLTHGIPSHDTLGDVLNRLKPK
ncbi:MAG: hypothetical protein ACJASU_000367 [Cognaticolwellia sp.]|jgi:hypothetical protein